MPTWCCATSTWSSPMCSVAAPCATPKPARTERLRPCAAARGEDCDLHKEAWDFPADAVREAAGRRTRANRAPAARALRQSRRRRALDPPQPCRTQDAGGWQPPGVSGGATPGDLAVVDKGRAAPLRTVGGGRCRGRRGRATRAPAPPMNRRNCSAVADPAAVECARVEAAAAAVARFRRRRSCCSRSAKCSMASRNLRRLATSQ